MVLVVSNGAYKSGSTWMFKLACHITKFPPPPKEYLDPDWFHPSLHSRKLVKFLNNVDHSSKNYISRNHFNTPKQKQLFSRDSNVLILNIKRDIRDVIVSAYYHDIRIDRYRGDFSDFYWRHGRKLVGFIYGHHALWDSPDIASKVHVSSYEALKNDFVNEVANMGKFLGFNLSEEELIDLKEKTTLEKLRGKPKVKEREEQLSHFRKGIVGDWINHFDQKMLDDLQHLEEAVLSELGSLESNFRVLRDRIKTIPGVQSVYKALKHR